MKRSIVALIAAIAILGLSNCQDGPLGPRRPGPCLCTTEFAQIVITILDWGGQPIPDLRLESVMVRTGETLDPALLPYDPVTGTYTIFNDSFKGLVHPLLRETGEELRVTGRLDTLVFSETFLVGVPGECACHVRKLSGPDTIYVMIVDGGSCRRIAYPGTAVITSAEPATDPMRTCLNAVEVRFTFIPADPSAPSRYLLPLWRDTDRRFVVGSGTPPPLNWAVSQGLVVGSEHRCVRLEITRGSCMPVAYRFPDIDYTHWADSCDLNH